MRILGFEASGLVASVAVVEDDILQAEYTINHKRTHSKTLMPMLDEVVKQLELELETIDAIAVAAGPGSYTGLRIISSTAKGLGMALDKPVISIPTIEGLAYNMWDANGYLCPIMDARRRQVYTGVYHFEGGVLITDYDQKCVEIDSLIEELPKEGTIIFLGDAVDIHREMLIDSLGDRAVFAPAHMNRQRAASIASLGLLYVKEGKTESAASHRPRYLKLSQAERERLDEGKDIVEPSDGDFNS